MRKFQRKVLRLRGWMLGCVFMTWTTTLPGVPPERQSNVILIVVESLRSDHVGCYGYARNTTPAIDALAADGIQFNRAFASSGWTMPSVMTLMTSRSPSDHGAISYRHALAAGITTLAAELRRGGYSTAGIVANPTLHGEYGFRSGFDLYDDFTILCDVPIDGAAERGDSEPIHVRSTSAETTRLAVPWLAARKNDPSKPFFLFLFYFDPHYDYLPISPYDALFTDSRYTGMQKGHGIRRLRGRNISADDKTQIMALYDGEIRCVDDQINQLLSELHRLGLYDSTMILVTGDHGEEFWDHGSTAHGHTLYDELLHVPLVVRLPGGRHAGKRIDANVGLIDVMPTILDSVGLPSPDPCQGRSLMPSLNEDWPSHVPLIAEISTEYRLSAIRLGARKAILKHSAAATGDVVSLFDLGEDPHEQRNLAGTAQEAGFTPLLSLLRSRRRLGNALPLPAKQKPALDPAVLRQLRSLGYVQ